MRDYAPDCPACEVFGARAKEGISACDTCRVVLAEENAEAARIYQLTRGQVVTVGEQVIDLNHVAVWKSIEKYKVKDQTGCFELVNKVFHYFLNKERET